MKIIFTVFFFFLFFFVYAKNDIFNLRWGMDEEVCRKICDWGGKKVSTEPKYTILKFDKAEMYGNLFFSKKKLYRVEFVSCYDLDDIDSGKKFFFYLENILKNKYSQVEEKNLTVRKICEEIYGVKTILFSMFSSKRSYIFLSFNLHSKNVYVIILTYFARENNNFSKKDAAGL